MSVFTHKEIEYLRDRQLGRLATVNAAGEPHVVPVGFRHNAELDTIDIGGHNLSRSKKFRDVARNGWATFVVDDVLPPWKARGVEVRGRAEFFVGGGQGVNADFGAELIRLHPSPSWAGGWTPTPTARTADRSKASRGSRMVDG